MPFFTGLVGGLSEGIAGARKEAADRNEKSAQLEAQILQHLSTSTDPEIASRALAGLLGHADPSTRKRAKGLRGFLGETDGNPALPMLRDFISAGRPGPDVPAAGSAGVPELAVQPGLPASASAPVAKPGALAQPATPGIHPGLSGPPPGPQAAAVRPGVTMAGPPVPRQVFRTPDEQAELTAAAHERGTLGVRTEAYRAAQTPGEQSVIPGVNNPPAWVATGTVQGKDVPVGQTDHTGAPILPGQYYSRRVSPQDASQAAYFPVAPPASIANQQAVNSRWMPIHKVGPDGKTPGVFMVRRDGSAPERFLGYQSVRGVYLPFTDPDTQEVTYQEAAAPLQQAPGMPAAAGATTPTAAPAAAPAGQAARPLAGPPPGPSALPGASGASGAPRPVGSGQTPAAAAAGGPRGGISGGRKRDLHAVEGAFMGPDGPVAGTAFLDNGLGQYFSSQDPTQPATGFIPGELGSYATQAYAGANNTLITIERAIRAIDDSGLAKNNDPQTTLALMAKFYGGGLATDPKDPASAANPVLEAMASLTNLAGIQGATQYVKSNSRSYQMFQAALMHLPRSPSEAVAQRSRIPGMAHVINPTTTGIVGGHGWDSPAVMRQKLELAKSVIQQGKASLSELVGKAPEKAVGAGGPPGPTGATGPSPAKTVPRGTSGAAAPATPHPPAPARPGHVWLLAPDGVSMGEVPIGPAADKAKAAGATVIQ